jgi:hypothetical protein
MKLSTTQIADGLFEIYYENGAYIGDLTRDIDGYYYYNTNGLRGNWSAHELRLIADLLDEWNKEWDKIVSKDVGSPK